MMFALIRVQNISQCAKAMIFGLINLKLQKQVDFLEINSNYAASCGDVYELTDSVMKRVFSKSNIITGKELATGNKIYTCSVVFRNIISLPEWFWECKMGDWILWLLLAQHGHFYNLSEPIAVYRIHQKGLWIGKGKEKNLIDILAALRNINGQYPIELYKGPQIWGKTTLYTFT